MKHIALTIKQLWALKIVFNSIFNALEKKEDGNYYIDNKKFFTFGGARSHDIQDGILNIDEYEKIYEY